MTRAEAIEAHRIAHEKKVLDKRRARLATERRHKERGWQAFLARLHASNAAHRI